MGLFLICGMPSSLKVPRFARAAEGRDEARGGAGEADEEVGVGGADGASQALDSDDAGLLVLLDVEAQAAKRLCHDLRVLAERGRRSG
jgi:hypothetical protein